MRNLALETIDLQQLHVWSWEWTECDETRAGAIARLGLLGDGTLYRTVQERLATTPATIARWKSRFLESGISGLIESHHPGQKPFVITPQLQAKVLAATGRKPKDGSTYLSCRKLARELGISKAACIGTGCRRA